MLLHASLLSMEALGSTWGDNHSMYSSFFFFWINLCGEREAASTLVVFHYGFWQQELTGSFIRTSRLACKPQVLGVRTCATVTSSLHVFRGSDSGLCACKMSTLLTEMSPLPNILSRFLSNHKNIDLKVQPNHIVTQYTHFCCQLFFSWQCCVPLYIALFSQGSALPILMKCAFLAISLPSWSFYS